MSGLTRLTRGRSAWLVVIGLVTVASCSTVSFYGQALRGQVEILVNREAVTHVISSPNTTAVRRQALIEVASILDFAGDTLGLPAQDRYMRVVEINRPYVVWNVVAADFLSTEPLARCYPVIGCAAYRGYFTIEGAAREANRLQRRGYDVHVSGIAAYSTLGWFDDPLLSTFLDWPVERLAELLFHELAHVVVYVTGDSAFNEAYASFVGERGVTRWLKERGGDVEAYRLRRQARYRLDNYLIAWRERLRRLYAGDDSEETKTERKRWAMQEIGRCYRRHRVLLGAGRFDGYMEAPFNNARLAQVATYGYWVPAFEALFSAGREDWKIFHADVIALSELPRGERDERMLRLRQEEEAKNRDDHGTEEIECEPLSDHSIDAEATG